MPAYNMSNPRYKSIVFADMRNGFGFLSINHSLDYEGFKSLSVSEYEQLIDKELHILANKIKTHKRNLKIAKGLENGNT